MPTNEEIKRPGSFAGLAGLLRSNGIKAAKAEDDDKDQDAKAKAEDDEDKKDAKASDDDGDENKKKDAKASDDDGDEDKKEKKDAKAGVTGLRRAIEEGGDNAGDLEDERDATLQAARSHERGRIHAILSCDAAQDVPSAALHLALETSMTRKNAIGTLRGLASAMPAKTQETTKAAADPLRSRMAEVDNPKVGASAPGKPDTSLAAQIIAAGKKRRGES